jgi:hypothetical protein
MEIIEFHLDDNLCSHYMIILFEYIHVLYFSAVGFVYICTNLPVYIFWPRALIMDTNDIHSMVNYSPYF